MKYNKFLYSYGIHFSLFFQLATGILSDVKTALQDFDRNGENQAFWGLVENALSKYFFQQLQKYA